MFNVNNHAIGMQEAVRFEGHAGKFIFMIRAFFKTMSPFKEIKQRQESIEKYVGSIVDTLIQSVKYYHKCDNEVEVRELFTDLIPDAQLEKVIMPEDNELKGVCTLFFRFDGALCDFIQIDIVEKMCDPVFEYLIA